MPEYELHPIRITLKNAQVQDSVLVGAGVADEVGLGPSGSPVVGKIAPVS